MRSDRCCAGCPSSRAPSTSPSAASVAATTEARTADLLGRLVDHSLVVRAISAASTRWRLLETVRVFADAKIDKAERADLDARHLRWAVTTAISLEAALDGVWMPDFDAVVDDLRGALARTSAAPDAVARRLARSLAHLAFARGYNREARAHYLAAADRPPMIARRSTTFATEPTSRSRDRTHPAGSRCSCSRPSAPADVAETRRSLGRRPSRRRSVSVTSTDLMACRKTGRNF